MVLGTYKEAVAARSTDKRIQEVAQDGGIASALLIYALENNIIEGAVVAGDPGDDWVPIPEIATTADEILSAAGTFGSPGIFIIAPVKATINPAPADTVNCLTVILNPVGLPNLV